MITLTPNINLEDESEIIWLKDKKHYDYVREGEHHTTYKSRSLQNIFKKTVCEATGGHIVAYAVLNKSARRGIADGYYRRIWWVKGYDRFDGHSVTKGGFYDHGAPAEAVSVDSIQVGKQSTGWDGTVNEREQTPPESNAG